MFIHRQDGELLAVAGLWAAWRPKDGGDDAEWVHSVSVITTSANATMAPVHDRMPVILPESVWAEWLDPNMHDTGRLQHLLVPADDDLLTLYPVSTEVNNARNNGAHLTTSIGID